MDPSEGASGRTGADGTPAEIAVDGAGDATGDAADNGATADAHGINGERCNGAVDGVDLVIAKFDNVVGGHPERGQLPASQCRKRLGAIFRTVSNQCSHAKAPFGAV